MERHTTLLIALLLPFTHALRAQDAVYCTPVIDVVNSAGSGITHVHLNGTLEIDHTSPVAEGYLFSDDSASLLVGGYYTLTIERSSGWTCPNNNLRAYIDFNGDGTFNETTETIALLNSGGDGVETFNFVVPGNSHPGRTRLRICEKQVQSCGQSAINSCGTGDSLGYRGEVEDHIVWISGQVGVQEDQPDAGITARSVPGSLILQLSRPAGSDAWLQVFDPSGRQLYMQDIAGFSEGEHRLPVPGGITGIVVLSVHSGAATSNQRLFLD